MTRLYSSNNHNNHRYLSHCLWSFNIV